MTFFPKKLARFLRGDSPLWFPFYLAVGVSFDARRAEGRLGEKELIRTHVYTTESDQLIQLSDNGIWDQPLILATFKHFLVTTWVSFLLFVSNLTSLCVNSGNLHHVPTLHQMQTGHTCELDGSAGQRPERVLVL